MRRYEASILPAASSDIDFNPVSLIPTISCGGDDSSQDFGFIMPS